MQLMITAYNISDIKILYFLSLKRRPDIFKNLVIVVFLVYLSFIATHSLTNFIFGTNFSNFYSIKRYNQYINDSNKSVEQRVVYFFNRRSLLLHRLLRLSIICLLVKTHRTYNIYHKMILAL